MNKIVVIFESKYGSTRHYATWIAEALSCPLFEKRKFHQQDLAAYDTLIYGGGLYAGGVSGIDLITKNWPIIREKNVVLFTCGLADPSEPENVRHIRDSLSKALSPEILEKIHLFHLRGGIDYSRLNFIHKAMMSMLRKMLLKKDPESLKNEDKQLLETYGKCNDFTRRETITPLVDYVLSLQTCETLGN